MNFDNFTIKSQEAIQQAVNIVRQHNGQSIEPVHLLKAVIDKGESVVKFIFQKLGANETLINSQVEKEIETQPKVTGGEQYLSRESNEILQKAIEQSQKLGDEYVTIESPVIAIFLA